MSSWLKLQKTLKEDLYDKGLNTMDLWLPVSDRRREGEWRDFYTENVIQNYTHPWTGSGPNGGKDENCAYLTDDNGWGDSACSYNGLACMCNQDPQIYLELKGIPPSTMIDRYYKLTSDYQDRRKTRD